MTVDVTIFRGISMRNTTMNTITGTTVTFSRPDGKSLSGYFARQNAADIKNAPAIVVIQEWWGLNDQIRGVANRLAQCGYQVLVPDLYRGQCTVEEEEAKHLMEGLDFGDAAAQDIRGAVQYLKTQASQVGITGFCMGGALAWLALCQIPELAAGVAWYGLPPLEFVQAENIRVPVLAHWGMQDEFFPPEQVDRLEAKLRNAQVDAQFHRYLAYHAFANEAAVGPGRIAQTQYDPVWAQQAWDRTLTFFGRTLWK
jgi:carboxymethylenebutenolidase